MFQRRKGHKKYHLYFSKKKPPSLRYGVARPSSPIAPSSHQRRRRINLIADEYWKGGDGDHHFSFPSLAAAIEFNDSSCYPKASDDLVGRERVLSWLVRTSCMNELLFHHPSAIADERVFRFDLGMNISILVNYINDCEIAKWYVR